MQQRRVDLRELERERSEELTEEQAEVTRGGYTFATVFTTRIDFAQPRSGGPEEE